MHSGMMFSHRPQPVLWFLGSMGLQQLPWRQACAARNGMQCRLATCACAPQCTRRDQEQTHTSAARDSAHHRDRPKHVAIDYTHQHVEERASKAGGHCHGVAASRARGHGLHTRSKGVAVGFGTGKDSLRARGHGLHRAGCWRAGTSTGFRHLFPTKQEAGGRRNEGTQVRGVTATLSTAPHQERRPVVQ